MLKHKADVRTLVFMAITMTLLGVQWTRLTFSWGLFLWSCLMGVVVAVMAHNHNHVSIWRCVPHPQPISRRVSSGLS